MVTHTIDDTLRLVRRHARPLAADDAGLDPVHEVVGNARFFLFGEASHGTHESYERRAATTRDGTGTDGWAMVGDGRFTLFDPSPAWSSMPMWPSSCRVVVRELW